MVAVAFIGLSGCVSPEIRANYDSCKKDRDMFSYKMNQLSYAQDYYPSLTATYSKHLGIAARNAVKSCSKGKFINSTYMNLIKEQIMR